VYVCELFGSCCGCTKICECCHTRKQSSARSDTKNEKNCRCGADRTCRYGTIARGIVDTKKKQQQHF
jgi:hypothetical protein